VKLRHLAPLCLLAACAARPHPVPDDPRWLTYRGGDGPGAGKHIVLIAAEQEYRSEESLPMLAKILAERHGFDCTVLFALDRNGMVNPTEEAPPKDPEVRNNIPGLEHLAAADLLILSNRFMKLPDNQLQRFVDYLESGKPLIGIRTANHGFWGPFPYEVGGKRVRFGDDVLGGEFRGHHGGWHSEATRGIVVEANRDHVILRGVADVFGTSDVYRTYPVGKGLPEGCTPLLLGQPLKGLKPDDAPNTDKEALPVAWAKTWTGNGGKTARVFHTTMGSARDFACEDLRRLVVNASYWCLGMEQALASRADVAIVGTYAPREAGFDYARLDVMPRPPAAFR
jgi:type 1 glutamine amidotransferase